MELHAGSPAPIPLIPDIDEGVPLPASIADALPPLSQSEELRMRAATIKLISDLTDTPVLPTEEDMARAEQIAREHMADPEKKLDLSKESNELQVYLAGLVSKASFKLVEELSDLKTYVVNKLVYEIEHAGDSKTRIAAVTKLGEVDGVDAFKRRTETTHVVKPMAEIEKELAKIIESVEKRVLSHEKAKQRAKDGVIEAEFESIPAEQGDAQP
jgi:vacuolar-type H+-ATPase subunit I/STV1